MRRDWHKFKVDRLTHRGAHAPRSCVRLQSNDCGSVSPFLQSLLCYTVAGIGVRLRPCANALRCKACQVQPRQFQTGFSIIVLYLFQNTLFLREQKIHMSGNYLTVADLRYGKVLAFLFNTVLKL